MTGGRFLFVAHCFTGEVCECRVQAHNGNLHLLAVTRLLIAAGAFSIGIDNASKYVNVYKILGLRRKTWFRQLQLPTGSDMSSRTINRDWFYRLASDLEDERVSAAVSLIKELSSLEMPDDAKEWSYVLKRLINGLASSRNSARLGFSLCLTEVVNLALTIAVDDQKPKELATIDGFFNLLSDTLSVSSDDDPTKRIKGKDERGLLFGKMFGLQALLNEPLFSQIFTENGSVSQFSVRFMDELAQLAIRKTWLREPCLFTLFRTTEKLLPFIDAKTIEAVYLLLDQYQLTLTNEGLAIYLLFLQNAPSESAAAASTLVLGAKCWKSNDPLARGNLPLLSQVLRSSNVSPELEDTASARVTNWNPRLHFVWDIILPILTKQEVTSSAIEASTGKPPSKKRKKEKRAIIEFPEFWQAAVDETFFNEKASSERKFLGFLIFNKTLDLVPAQWTQHCFSQNYMRSLINQSSDSKRLLFKMAQKSLQKIVSVCEKHPSEKLVPCLESILFGPNGSVSFDRLTKSKTVSRLIAVDSLSDDDLSKLFDCLASQLSKMSIQQKNDIQFALDTSLHAIRSHKSQITARVSVKGLLHPIIISAFFLKENEEINKLARERLNSILSELMSIPNESHSWQFQALEIIFQEESLGKELANPLDETLKEIKDTSVKVLEDVSTAITDPRSRGLESLLSMCVLGMYSGEAESVSIIEELCTFHKQIADSSTYLVGLTEILLSLLAQKKSLFRKLSLLVWQQFINVVEEDELELLLNVLGARENKKGFTELFQAADEEEEGTENEDSEAFEENEEDVEDDSGSDNNSSADNESEIYIDAKDGNEDIAKIDKEATSALAKALNIPENVVNDKGEVDFDQLDDLSGGESDDDDEEIESMDDEMMMQLDGQLSEIFRRRKEALTSVSTSNDRKIEAKESREDVIAFKHRIVDMLEIYVKFVEKSILSENVRPASIRNLLLFIKPMILCVRETVDKSLALRISKILKTKVYKIKSIEFRTAVEDIKKIFEMLVFTHEMLLVKKPGLHQVVYHSLCSTTSLFLAKIFVGKPEQTDVMCGKVIDLYAGTMKQWVSQGKFGPNVFIDLVNWLAARKQAPQV